MIVGLTSGCFDLLHWGHLDYLSRCAQLCDRLIVGVDSDAMVAEAKGPLRPIVPELERVRLIQCLGMVSEAFLLHHLDGLADAVRQYGAAKVFKHQGFADIRHVAGVHDTTAELVIVPDVEGLVSTTEIINRVIARYGPYSPP